jgi:hypothetical protein
MVSDLMGGRIVGLIDSNIKPYNLPADIITRIGPKIDKYNCWKMGFTYIHALAAAFSFSELRSLGFTSDQIAGMFEVPSKILQKYVDDLDSQFNSTQAEEPELSYEDSLKLIQESKKEEAIEILRLKAEKHRLVPNRVAECEEILEKYKNYLHKYIATDALAAASYRVVSGELGHVLSQKALGHDLNQKALASVFDCSAATLSAYAHMMFSMLHTPPPTPEEVLKQQAPIYRLEKAYPMNLPSNMIGGVEVKPLHVLGNDELWFVQDSESKISSHHNWIGIYQLYDVNGFSIRGKISNIYEELLKEGFKIALSKEDFILQLSEFLKIIIRY